MNPFTIRVRLRRRDLPRLAGLACLLLALPLLILWAGAGHAGPAAPAAPAALMYYITDASHTPDEALTACADGYHFASLWEIVDPTGRRYNTALGQTTLDSGSGPPTTQGLGWVRTGYNFADTTGAAGQANCALWTSQDSGDLGTVVGLPNVWTAGTSDLGAWETGTRTCNFNLGVWCVQDVVWHGYLPLVTQP